MVGYSGSSSIAQACPFTSQFVPADKAVAAAKAAQPAWAAASPQVRHDVLEKVGAAIMARKDELGRLLSREEGKTLAEGIGETIRAAQIFKFFAGETMRTSGSSASSGKVVMRSTSLLMSW